MQSHLIRLRHQLVVLVVLSSTRVSFADPVSTPFAPGPVITGNGLTDGIGATLGRFFVRLTRGGAAAPAPIPLELLFTSSTVKVDPITCSGVGADPCAEDARHGNAGVAGYPTVVHDSVMAVKLASARYLFREPAELHGFSLEVALEGSLYTGPKFAPGDPADFHLFIADPVETLDWSRGDAAAARDYGHNTGAAWVLGDEGVFLFPGWFRGEVAENNGATVFVQFTAAEILPVRVGNATRTWLEPDPEAARQAGLPQGVFGQVEVNYSGIATRSHVLPGAASNDVELHVTAEPIRTLFLRGDCNGDGSLGGTATDVVFLLHYNFLGGTRPPCLAACDANGDGNAGAQVIDAIYLLMFLFRGGPPPPPPFPACGAEPRPSGLDCDLPLECS